MIGHSKVSRYILLGLGLGMIVRYVWSRVDNLGWWVELVVV
jgi:hypothetical protein